MDYGVVNVCSNFSLVSMSGEVTNYVNLSLKVLMFFFISVNSYCFILGGVVIRMFR